MAASAAGVGAARRSSAPPPSPTRRFARQPAYGDEQAGESEHIDGEATGRQGGPDESGADADQKYVHRDDDPSLPGRGKAPSPAVALGGKPVSPITGHCRPLVVHVEAMVARYGNGRSCSAMLRVLSVVSFPVCNVVLRS